MNGLAKAVYALVGALVLLSSVMVFALIFVPGFGAVAPTMVAAILGPLTTALSVLGGIMAARGLRNLPGVPPDDEGGQ